MTRFLAPAVLLLCVLGGSFTAMPAFALETDENFGVGPGQTVIPCGNEVVDGRPVNPCQFGHLVLMVNAVIEWLILFSVPVAAIMFAFAGFLMVTASGSETQIARAKTVFTNVAIGFIFIISAWLIVELIVSVLVDEGFVTTLFS